MFRCWINFVSHPFDDPSTTLADTCRAIFASAWFQQRYGYRRLLQTGLVAMFCFIFITFFAQNIVSRDPSTRVIPLILADHAGRRVPFVWLGLVRHILLSCRLKRL